MLTEQDHPVAWAMLVHELRDATDHLNALVRQMYDAGAIDDVDYAIQLAHVYTHLNRAWHGRDDENLDQVTEEQFAQNSELPTDLNPF